MQTVIVTMLSRSKSKNYKVLARTTQLKECLTSDHPISEVVIDFRSRLFMYIRCVYCNMPFKHKINRLFIAIEDLDKEKKRVFQAALAKAKREVSLMRVSTATYVFASQIPCSYKSKNTNTGADVRLKQCIQDFRRNMLNVNLLHACINALESYIISDIDNICTIYKGLEQLFVKQCAVPKDDDAFESDRMCARIGSTAVLSEDFDCLALFGADFMVKNVYNGFFEYITLKDVMNTFNSTTRINLVQKCCLMGTDYNLGLMGVGPVKVRQIDDNKASSLCNVCLSAQSIQKDMLWEFFRLA